MVILCVRPLRRPCVGSSPTALIGCSFGILQVPVHVSQGQPFLYVKERRHMINNQEIEKLANGERIAELVRKIDDDRGRDMVVSMCSGLIEGYILATDRKREKEVRRGI